MKIQTIKPCCGLLSFVDLVLVQWSDMFIMTSGCKLTWTLTNPLSVFNDTSSLEEKKETRMLKVDYKYYNANNIISFSILNQLFL